MGERWHLKPEMEQTHFVDSWNVRASPSFDAAVLRVLKVGEPFAVSGRQGDWLQVPCDNGAVGYANCKYGDAEALAPVSGGAGAGGAVGSSVGAAGDFQQIGNQFVQHYFQAFDSNRASLAPLYSDTSMLSFEGEQFQGSQAILQKLTSLQMSIKHQVLKADHHPIQPTNGVMSLVVGNLFVDGSTVPVKFSRMFSLAPTPNSSVTIVNDMFRVSA